MLAKDEWETISRISTLGKSRRGDNQKIWIWMATQQLAEELKDGKEKKKEMFRNKRSKSDKHTVDGMKTDHYEMLRKINDYAGNDQRELGQDDREVSRNRIGSSSCG